MVKKRGNTFSMMLLLAVHFILSHAFTVNAETTDVVNRGTYNVTNVKTEDDFNVSDGTTTFNYISENDITQQNFQFVYDRREEAYRIYIIEEDSEQPSKVLDIVRIDKKIVSGCHVQAYYPLDNSTQLWCITSNPDGTFAVRPKYNQDLALALGEGLIVTTYNEEADECRWNFSLLASPLLMDPYDCMWRYMFRQPKMARHISQGYHQNHYGVDIISSAGDIANDYPLYCVSSGEVIYSAPSPSAGNYIVIALNDGYTVRYLHMKETSSYKKGDKVTGDSMLGIVGNTGESYGAHLHFDVNTVGGISGGTQVKYETTVNPLEFFPDYAFTGNYN